MKRRTQVAALVASAAMALTGVVVATAPVQAAPDPEPAQPAAAWMANQLVDGLAQNTASGDPDYGLSIDVGLALHELGGFDETVAEIADALAPVITDRYAQKSVEGEDADTAEPIIETYSGSLAKSVVFAQTVEESPATWAGADLIELLEQQVTTDGRNKGRIFDTSQWGDYANVLGQTFAAAGLIEAESDQAKPVLQFLLQQQCPEGFFRVSFAPKDAADQSCEAGIATGESTPNVDTTALVVQHLDGISLGKALATFAGDLDTITKMRQAVRKAAIWLRNEQHRDGSFSGGTATEGFNANSTGMAGLALARRGNTKAARKAAAWLQAHQGVPIGQCGANFGSDAHAIAYDDAALADGYANGITNQSRDQWMRATAQAVVALNLAPNRTSTPVIAGPKGYVKRGTKHTYQLDGLVPGQLVCFTFANRSPRVVQADFDGAATVTVRVPKVASEPTASLADRAGQTASTSTLVLAKTKLKVRVKKRKKLKAKKRTRVAVRGLAPRERVRVKLRKRIVARGRANNNGVYRARIKVGKRIGKAKVKALGQFPALRRGAKKVKISR